MHSTRSPACFRTATPHACASSACLHETRDVRVGAGAAAQRMRVRARCPCRSPRRCAGQSARAKRLWVRWPRQAAAACRRTRASATGTGWSLSRRGAAVPLQSASSKQLAFAIGLTPQSRPCTQKPCTMRASADARVRCSHLSLVIAPTMAAGSREPIASHLHCVITSHAQD